MLYCLSIDVPANTTKEDPLITTLPVIPGTVRRLWVRWRWGSGNLCGCAIHRSLTQVWPSIIDEWFPSTTQDLTFEEVYPVKDEPLSFRVKAFNLDDTFPHTVWVGILILTSEIPLALYQWYEYLAKQGGK